MESDQFLSDDAQNGDKPLSQEMADNQELLEAMLSMPDEHNKALVEERRKELFSFLWEYTELTEQETLTNVKAREQDVLDEYSDDFPADCQWVLRIHAQDLLLEMMEDELSTEGLL